MNSPANHGGTGNMNMASAAAEDALPVSIQTVSDQKSELGRLGNTWPGEIISLGDIQIQPTRAGTIVEWNVNIGQKIRRGQVIAALSPPPAMPELTSMLAEQAKMVTETRVDAKAQIEFAEKKKLQLITLLSALEKAKMENIGMLDSTNTATSIISAANAIRQTDEAVKIAEQRIRASLEQAINREFRLIGYNAIDVVSYYKLVPTRLYIKNSLGELNLNSRSLFVNALDQALQELTSNNSNLTIVGTAYFEALIKMVAASYATDELTSDQLTEIRAMAAMDQMGFLEAIKDYRMSKAESIKMQAEYKLMLTEKETDYAMQRKEIEEQIAMLEKDITMSSGRVEAAEVSYNTVVGGINGGLAIVSPANGVISSVMKKNGDFVEPGMAIASINTGRKEDRFVRFKIPSNIRLPEPGSELIMVRPGFLGQARKVRLIGVGTALDGNGSYMADAKFVDAVDWPVNVSIRVMPREDSASTLFVNAGALEWTDSGATIWTVKTDNTIAKLPVKTGRVLGERIEIYDGLSLGDKYINKITPALQEGIKVKEGEAASTAPITDSPHAGM